MSASSRIWRGTVFVSGANILARVGTFLGNLVIIRLLGLELTGELGLMEGWLSLVTVFSVFGLNNAVTRYMAHDLEADTERVGASAGSALLLAFGLSVMISVLLYLALPLLGNNGLAGTTGEILAGQRSLFACLVLIYTLRHMVLGLVYGLQTFPLLLWSNFAVGLVSLPLSYLLVRWQGLAGALEVRLVVALLETCLLWAGLRRHFQKMGIRVSLHAFGENARRLMGFAVPTFVGQVVANPVPPLMMSLLAAQPGGILQVGLLTTGQRLVSLVSFIPGSMATTVMPVLAGEWGRGDPARFGRSVLVALRMLWLTSLAPVLFFMAASPALLGWLYGSEYVAGWPMALLFLAASLLTAVNESADRSLAAAGRMWLSTGNNAVWSVLFLGLAVWLVPHGQGLGYALAFVVSFALYVALQFGWLKRLFGMPVGSLASMAALSGALALLALGSASTLPAVAQLAAAAGLALLAVLVQWRFFLGRAEKERIVQQVRGMHGRLALLVNMVRAAAGFGARGPE